VTVGDDSVAVVIQDLASMVMNIGEGDFFPTGATNSFSKKFCSLESLTL
jgi:hypothetical protein